MHNDDKKVNEILNNASFDGLDPNDAERIKRVFSLFFDLNYSDKYKLKKTEAE